MSRQFLPAAVLLLLIAVCHAAEASVSAHRKLRQDLVSPAFPTCAAEMHVICEEAICPLLCTTTRCASRCQGCCQGLSFASTVEVLTGGPPPPQCVKFFQTYTDIPVNTSDNGASGKVANAVCDKICADDCGFFYPGDAGCLQKCAPCCKGKLGNDLCVPGTTVPQCSSFSADYPLVYQQICFPADATVELQDGTSRRMDELRIGDRVAVMHNNGGIGYEPVYQFGHKDAKVLGLSYVKLTVANAANVSASLKLAELHYLPIVESSGAVRLTRAVDVQMGQIVFMPDWAAGKSVEAVITGKQPVVARGAFSPYTLDGNIIVNGVVASSHNDWVIANHVVPSYLKPLLPSLYDLLLTGHRTAYRVLGADMWASLNDHFDFSLLAFRKQFSASMLGSALWINRASQTKEV